MIDTKTFGVYDIDKMINTRPFPYHPSEFKSNRPCQYRPH